MSKPKKSSKSFKANNPDLRAPKIQHIRHIKPEYAVHDGVNNMTVAARYAETYAWTCCDKYGRFEWNPRSLKRLILPYDDVDFETLMLEWVREGLCEQYEMNGKKYGRFFNWEKHQAINLREKESPFEYPGPPLHGAITVPARADTSMHLQAGAVSERKGKGEGKGEGERDGDGEYEDVGESKRLAGGLELLTPKTENIGNIGNLGQENMNQTKLWTDLQRTWDEHYKSFTAVPNLPSFDENDAAPTYLPRTELDALVSTASESGIGHDEIVEVFSFWLSRKYNDTLNTAPIKLPLTVFPLDLPFFAQKMQAEKTERAGNAAKWKQGAAERERQQAETPAPPVADVFGQP